MRYSDRVTFVTTTGDVYNPITGRYDKADTETKVMPCNASTVGLKRKKELFGSINEDILVVRLLKPYNDPFDYVVVNDKQYQVTQRSDYRRGVFFLTGGSYET